jgi:hypothetical protein
VANNFEGVGNKFEGVANEFERVANNFEGVANNFEGDGDRFRALWPSLKRAENANSSYARRPVERTAGKSRLLIRRNALGSR